jgi:hypothetical protein
MTTTTKSNSMMMMRSNVVHEEAAAAAPQTTAAAAAAVVAAAATAVATAAVKIERGVPILVHVFLLVTLPPMLRLIPCHIHGLRVRGLKCQTNRPPAALPFRLLDSVCVLESPARAVTFHFRLQECTLGCLANSLVTMIRCDGLRVCALGCLANSLVTMICCDGLRVCVLTHP